MDWWVFTILVILLSPIKYTNWPSNYKYIKLLFLVLLYVALSIYFHLFSAMAIIEVKEENPIDIKDEDIRYQCIQEIKNESIVGEATKRSVSENFQMAGSINLPAKTETAFCHIYDYKSASQEQSSLHLRQHAKDKIVEHVRQYLAKHLFSCQICNYKSMNRSQWKQHMKGHMNKIFVMEKWQVTIPNLVTKLKSSTK